MSKVLCRLKEGTFGPQLILVKSANDLLFCQIADSYAVIIRAEIEFFLVVVYIFDGVAVR